MRYVVANSVTALIAAVLVVAAVLFAWARSGAGRAPAVPGSPGPAAIGALGRDVYAAECGFCHGNRVDDRAELGRMADDLYRVEGGAAELVDLLLEGFEATPDRDLDHPPFDHLGDEQVAALLEYLLAYGPAEETAGARPPITASDVAARRRSSSSGRKAFQDLAHGLVDAPREPFPIVEHAGDVEAGPAAPDDAVDILGPE